MSVYAEFRAPVTSYPLSDVLARHPGVSMEVDAIVPTGGSSHYVWVEGDDLKTAVEDLRSNARIDDVAVLDELAERVLVRFEWSTTESPLFALVEEDDGVVVGATGTAEGWSLRIKFPDQAALARFYDRSQVLGLDVDLQQLIDRETRLVDDGFDISPKQRETLASAIEAGYFDVPRQVTLEELAADLGISEQSVSERLRRGLASFLRATLGEDGTGESKGGDEEPTLD